MDPKIKKLNSKKIEKLFNHIIIINCLRTKMPSPTIENEMQVALFNNFETIAPMIKFEVEALGGEDTRRYKMTISGGPFNTCHGNIHVRKETDRFEIDLMFHERKQFTFEGKIYLMYYTIDISEREEDE